MKTASLTLPPTAKPLKVLIDIDRGHADCEDYGFYDWAQAKVTVAGRTLMAHYDGHMGGGNWSGDNNDLYCWALLALGVKVLVNGEQAKGPVFYQRSPGHDWEPVDLCSQPQELVQLAMHSEPLVEHPGHTHNTSVSWSSPNARESRLEVPTGWDGQVESLYLHLLAERATVRVRERRS